MNHRGLSSTRARERVRIVVAVALTVSAIWYDTPVAGAPYSGRLDQQRNSDELLAREGTGAAQLAYLYQLRSGLRMNNSELTEAQIHALDSLVQADPLGAWSAKTMLRVLRGHPYKRIPWMLNDTIAGYRSSSQTHVRTSHLTILPNPADQMVLVRSIKPMYSVAVIGADGRICLRLAFAGELEVQFDISALAPGPYMLRVGTVGSETIERIIVH